ncbi:uncharacterized protein LOC135848812 [Planococcus citri]|uniref:uncharacterized protein LOC135848812 n=1 Tax=Planococcus citri TaxID=170843 RepID=UPI0031FA4298
MCPVPCDPIPRQIREYLCKDVHAYNKHRTSHDCSRSINPNNIPKCRRPNQCRICERWYISATGKLAHVKRIHRRRCYRCGVCDFVVDTSNTVIQHQKNLTQSDDEDDL